MIQNVGHNGSLSVFDLISMCKINFIKFICKRPLLQHKAQAIFFRLAQSSFIWHYVELNLCKSLLLHCKISLYLTKYSSKTVANSKSFLYLERVSFLFNKVKTFSAIRGHRSIKPNFNLVLGAGKPLRLDRTLSCSMSVRSTEFKSRKASDVHFSTSHSSTKL